LPVLVLHTHVELRCRSPWERVAVQPFFPEAISVSLSASDKYKGPSSLQAGEMLWPPKARTKWSTCLRPWNRGTLMKYPANYYAKAQRWPCAAAYQQTGVLECGAVEVPLPATQLDIPFIFHCQAPPHDAPGVWSSLWRRLLFCCGAHWSKAMSWICSEAFLGFVGCHPALQRCCQTIFASSGIHGGNFKVGLCI